jgi:hypothetical protein
VAGLSISGAGPSDSAIRELATYQGAISNQNDKCIIKVKILLQAIINNQICKEPMLQ